MGHMSNNTLANILWNLPATRFTILQTIIYKCHKHIHYRYLNVRAHPVAKMKTSIKEALQKYVPPLISDGLLICKQS